MYILGAHAELRYAATYIVRAASTEILQPTEVDTTAAAGVLLDPMGKIKGQRHTLTRTDAKFDVAEALKLRLVHKLTYPEIGRLLGVDASAVWRRLKRFHEMVNDPEAAVAYHENEAVILDSLRMRAVANMLKPGALEGASPRDLAVVFGIAFDKMRLLRGQSTSNVGLKAALILQAHEQLEEQDKQGAPQAAPVTT